MMFIKIHKTYRNVVAVCDKNIIGKKFEEGKKILEVKETFFKGDEFEADEILKMMIIQAREDATFNIVGEESVAVALRADLIEERNIGSIQGVPIVLIF